MERYRNLDGGSGVVAYEIGRGWIIVEFRGGAAYLYDDESAGAANIAEMHKCPALKGLATFISQVVKKGYARQLSRGTKT